MPYIQNEYRIKNTIEIEKYFTGRLGNKTKGKRKKPSTEEMRAINDKNAEKKLRRKIEANFDEDDIFLTWTYKKEKRPDPKEASKRIKKALTILRKQYKQKGEVLKYIIVTEYMKTAIHHHLIVNELPDGTGTKHATKVWKENGGTHATYLYEDGQYENLAAYIIKETSKNFRKKDNPSKLRYSCSKNLIDPKPIKRRIRSNAWRKEPKAPKGWYVVKDTIYQGINKFGYGYQYYRMKRLKDGREEDKFVLRE